MIALLLTSSLAWGGTIVPQQERALDAIGAAAAASASVPALRQVVEDLAERLKQLEQKLRDGEELVDD